MEKTNKNNEKLSYESDGKMGQNDHMAKPDQQEKTDFFNTTQNSE